MGEKIKDKNGGFFHNNLLISRGDDDPIIISEGDFITVRLNGYAIIPIEQYSELKGLPFTDRASINSMQKKLGGPRINFNN